MANDGVHSKLHCWACTGPMYGCMGLGALAKLTQKPQHIALLRNAADWMLANQFLRDTHYGCARDCLTLALQLTCLMRAATTTGRPASRAPT